METKTGIGPIPQYGIGSIVAEQAAIPVKERSLSPIGRVFGVYVDPKTWGALFYVLFSLVTGVLYFSWAVTGLSLSIGLLVFVIGLPLATVFLLSARGVAMLEASLVQAVLGVAVAPGPMFRQAGLKWLERVKALVADRRTWRSLLYMVLQLPLSVIYFSVTVTLMTLALGFMAIPVAYISDAQQILVISGQRMIIRPWVLGVLEIGGFLLLTLTLNLVRSIGRMHGKYARSLLAG